MEKTILNFHFDYLNPSLSSTRDMKLFHVIDNMQFLHYLPALLTSKEYQPKSHLHFSLMLLDPPSPSFRTFFSMFEEKIVAKSQAAGKEVKI